MDKKNEFELQEIKKVDATPVVPSDVIVTKDAKMPELAPPKITRMRSFKFIDREKETKPTCGECAPGQMCMMMCCCCCL